MTTLLSALPIELITVILENLDYLSLLRCRLLCQQFREIVDTSAALQYIIELCGTYVDGNTRLDPSNKLQLLRTQKQAWQKIEWTENCTVPKLGGNTWELFGNVLAQSNPQGDISFIQLPSSLRNIERKDWTVSKSEWAFKVRDFVMDPSQDLLVLVQAPKWRGSDADHTHRVHFRSLTTGQPHPLAPKNIALELLQPTREEVSYTLQVCRDHVGVLIHSNEAPNEMVVWNWKLGKRVLDVVDKDCRMTSFVFFTESTLMLGVLEFPDDPDVTQEFPAINIVDFSAGDERQVTLDDLRAPTRRCLLLPELRTGTIPVRVDVRSDPSPGWTPSEDLQTPFHLGTERLFIISLSLVESFRLSPVAFFTLQSSILDLLNVGDSDDEELNRDIPWETWGPERTRMTEASFSPVWACYTFGTKCVLPFKRRDKDGKTYFRIIDFDKKSINKAPKDEISAPNFRLRANNWFQDQSLTTSLPFRMCMRESQGVFRPSFSPMIAEDSLIVVDSMSSQYRVFTF